MAEKRPSFQFYPKDFLTDENVRLMSNTELGIYIKLLSLCWLQSSLPADMGQLGRLVHLSRSRMERMWLGPLGRCFTRGEDGRLTHKRLDLERLKQDSFRRRASDGGRAKAAAAPIKQTFSSAEAVLNGCLEPATDRTEADSKQSFSSAKSCSSSSSSISSSSSTAVQARAHPDDIGRRAGVLLENYGRWYEKHRDGAKLPLIHNSLQFSEACRLCDTWDDARLEKLAALVLTTDDAFIAGTDRGFKIFALKASWADDRLRQWEKAKGVAV